MKRKSKNQSKHKIPWFFWLFISPYVVILVPIYMLWKLHNEKDNISDNAKKTEIAGWFYFGLGCIYLILGITGQWRYEDGRSAVGWSIVLFALMGGIGYAIVRNARKYKYLGLLYKRYFPVISGSATGYLDKIAEVFDEPYEETVENIQKLIDIKLFENSYPEMSIAQIKECMAAWDEKKVCFAFSLDFTIDGDGIYSFAKLLRREGFYI